MNNSKRVHSLIQREDPSHLIDRVREKLDFSKCKRLLLQIENRASRDDIDDSIQNAINQQIEVGIHLGWEAARNPAAWIFKDGDPANGFSDDDPCYGFWQRIEQFDIGEVHAPAKLSDEVSGLMSEAGERGFAFGWQLHSNHDWLIFNTGGAI